MCHGSLDPKYALRDIETRVAEYRGALHRLNGFGTWMPGFDGMMEGLGEPGLGKTKAKTGGDPQGVRKLTVFETVAALVGWTQLRKRGDNQPALLPHFIAGAQQGNLQMCQQKATIG